MSFLKFDLPLFWIEAIYTEIASKFLMKLFKQNHSISLIFKILNFANSFPEVLKKYLYSNEVDTKYFFLYFFRNKYCLKEMSRIYLFFTWIFIFNYLSFLSDRFDYQRRLNSDWHYYLCRRELRSEPFVSCSFDNPPGIYLF